MHGFAWPLEALLWLIVHPWVPLLTIAGFIGAIVWWWKRRK